MLHTNRTDLHRKSSVYILTFLCVQLSSEKGSFVFHLFTHLSNLKSQKNDKKKTNKEGQNLSERRIGQAKPSIGTLILIRLYATNKFIFILNWLDATFLQTSYVIFLLQTNLFLSWIGLPYCKLAVYLLYKQARTTQEHKKNLIYSLKSKSYFMEHLISMNIMYISGSDGDKDILKVVNF